MIKGQGRMRRRIGSFVVLVAVTWIAATPAFGSCMTVGGETVCGRVIGFTGDCDGPGTTCNAGSGFVGVFGFAMASTGVERVEIVLESVQFPGEQITLGRATYGELNPEATDLYPGFPDSAFPGWSYNINSTLFGNGEYDVWARVVTVGGNAKELGAEQVLFTNNETVLRPFGEIDRPGQNEDVFGTCSQAFCGDGVCEIGLAENCLNCPFDCNGQELGLFGDFCCGYGAGSNPLECDDPQPPAFPGGPTGGMVCQEGGFTCSDERRIRYTVVSGWALDLGLTEEDTGISWVELLTNGAFYGDTRTSCEFNAQTGGLTNCYGLPRIDLENRFPFAFDAPSAGYRFVLDVGALLLTDSVTLGSNEIIVRAGDWSNQFEDIHTISVNFLCAEDFSEAAFGEVESPREGRLYNGFLTFEGWALDGEGVDRVEVYVDGELVPGTQYGAGLGTRPLVEADYPGFGDTDQPVWRLADFDTTTLNNGFHTVQVRAVDDEGDSNFIGGEVTFRVDNTTFAIMGLYKSAGARP